VERKRTLKRSKAKRGRPKKFDEPSRAVTVTLPDSVIKGLAAIHEDRAMAIAEACQNNVFRGEHPISVEVVQAGPGRGLILVGTSKYLDRLDCMRLVRITPERHLITVKARTPIASVEIALRDLLDSIPLSDEWERKMVASLATLFRRTRQLKVMHKEEILIIPHDFAVDDE
jgi:hypothetical protein